MRPAECDAMASLGDEPESTPINLPKGVNKCQLIRQATSSRSPSAAHYLLKTRAVFLSVLFLCIAPVPAISLCLSLPPNESRGPSTPLT